jgi:hypothetical protein
MVSRESLSQHTRGSSRVGLVSVSVFAGSQQQQQLLQDSETRGTPRVFSRPHDRVDCDEDVNLSQRESGRRSLRRWDFCVDVRLWTVVWKEVERVWRVLVDGV